MKCRKLYILEVDGQLSFIHVYKSKADAKKDITEWASPIPIRILKFKEKKSVKSRRLSHS